MEHPDFWLNNTSAQTTISELKQLRAWTTPYSKIKSSFSDIKALLPEALEIEDKELVNELLENLHNVEKELSDLEVRKMLSGELDFKNCYLSINSGAGGTESCDWVEMLTRMYQRWVAKRGWEIEMIEATEGEVAGLKSITMKITGDFAYGYTKAERGVHRLVRISPFDSGARRHTSFASVDVSPEITDDIVVNIKPDDLRTRKP